MKNVSNTLIALSFFISGITHAATIVSDNFDAGLNGWTGNTTQTNVSNPLTGGNPNGYLITDNLGNNTSFGAVGSVNTGADYSGVFIDGIWNISVDLNFANGSFNDAWLRYRYQDSTANGWHISLTDTFSPSWNNYSVSFDTTWSDAEAMLNGWVKEADGTLTSTPSFAALWDNVYSSEVRFLGNSSMSAGIDNYQASVVPVPAAAWLFSSGLLGFIGIARRKRKAVNAR